MVKKMIWNDIKEHKLHSGAMCFFMTISAMLLALTAMLFSGLVGAIDHLMDIARVPDYMQMHREDTFPEIFSGEDPKENKNALWETEIADFVQNNKDVDSWQIRPFLNLDNSNLTLGGESLADSTQDNGLALQGERFDFLLDTENNIPEVLPGEVYVPVCYRSLYDLAVGDIMICYAGTSEKYELVIVGFLRDAQMNSMMASSKRFLVNETDYKRIKKGLESKSRLHHASGICREEYLIEFLLKEQADVNTFGAAYAAAQLPANGPAITRPLIRMMNALSDGTMIAVIFLVGIAVLVVSMLCVQFLLSLQIERDRKEVGMLKALGIGKMQIRHIYFAKYILFCACGAIAGLLAAFALKVPLARQAQELYGAAAGGTKTVFLSVLSVCFTEGVILLIIRRPLKRIDRLAALEALLSLPEKRTGKGQCFMIGSVAAACVFLALVPRSLYGTMSAPEFITYMGIGESDVRMDVRQDMNQDAGQRERSGSCEGADSATERIALALEQDRQVERYVALRTVSCQAVPGDGRAVNLMVETGDHSIFPVKYSKGRLPKNEGEIALSSLNAEELELDVGDRLRLTDNGNEADENGKYEEEFMVCGIYSDITNGGKTAKAYKYGGNAPVVWDILYVSLKDFAKKEPWMAGYRAFGADIIDIEDYVKNTYGQTLGQLRTAAGIVLGIAAAVLMAVAMLFVRLLVEKNRYAVSLYKALGFTGADMRRIWFAKGMFPVITGLGAGLLAERLLGERLCGVALKSFGADSFRFVAVSAAPGILILLFIAAAAVWVGTGEISKIKAYECCLEQD